MAKVTDQFVGADLKGVVDRAVEAKLQESIRAGLAGPAVDPRPAGRCQDGQAHVRAGVDGDRAQLRDARQRVGRLGRPHAVHPAQMVTVRDSLERARLLLQMGRPADAERELRGVLTEEPQHAGAHALLGLALVQQDRTDEALEESREGVRLAPDHYVPHYLSGQVHFQAGLVDEAVRAVVAGLALSPEHAPSWELLARVHMTRHDWPQMAETADRGLGLDPQHAELASLLAIALVMLGQNERARAVATQAVGNDPESALAHWAYGRAALAAGDPKTAAESFREVLRLDPGFDAARDLLVYALKQRNPVYRLLAKLRFRVSWRLLFLLPALPPVIAVFVISALLHWAAWVAESWTTLRLARAKATRLLFEGAAGRVSLLCLALPVA
ncbi:tetratricopeptide repeat protein [Nonomuraea ferruginea]